MPLIRQGKTLRTIAAELSRMGWCSYEVHAPRTAPRTHCEVKYASGHTVGGKPLRQDYLGKVISRVPAAKNEWDKQVEVTR